MKVRPLADRLLVKREEASETVAPVVSEVASPPKVESTAEKQYII